MSQTIKQRLTLVAAHKRHLRDMSPREARDLGDELDNKIQWDWYTFKLADKWVVWVTGVIWFGIIALMVSGAV